MTGDVPLSRPRKARDLVMRVRAAATLRCCSCGKRFDKLVSPTQLDRRTAHGRSHSLRSLVVPITDQRARAILVVDDFNPFCNLIRETLAPRGFAVFGANSPDEGLALFQAHQPQIDLAVIDLVTPTAGNLDLTAELERLHPGLPVLYLVGAGKTIARCSIEAQAPGSVLAVPFTEEQLIARVGSLLDVEGAARRRSGERLWERLAANSDRMASTTRPY
jgi:DNA-binding NtrC family response regulator